MTGAGVAAASGGVGVGSGWGGGGISGGGSGVVAAWGREPGWASGGWALWASAGVDRSRPAAAMAVSEQSERLDMWVMLVKWIAR
jgi:hypothetical protein